MDADEEALTKIMGDMDDMESSRVFGKKSEPVNKGVDITISVIPNTGEEKDEDYPAENMMSKGGVMDEDMGMPPYLRKKKSR